ncbi:hypothetical protein ACFLRA_00160 [Bdellovibrionota bacterium]
MARIKKGYKSPFPIIRFLLLGILVMVALLFAKYLYAPKNQVLVEYLKVNQELEERKRELTSSIAQYRGRSKTPSRVRPDPQKSFKPVLMKIPMEQLLSDFFIIGDVEKVDLLRVEPGKNRKGITPIEFAVKGAFWDTLDFLKQVMGIKGVGGISAISIKDAYWEIDRYVVNTTITVPTKLE